MFLELYLANRCYVCGVLLTILDKVAYNHEITTVTLVDLLRVIQDSLVVIAIIPSYGYLLLKLFLFFQDRHIYLRPRHIEHKPPSIVNSRQRKKKK